MALLGEYSMKFLINNKEYSHYLAHRLAMRDVQSRLISDPAWKKISKARVEIQKILNPELANIKLKPRDSESRARILHFLQTAAEGDMNRWIKNVCTSDVDQKSLLRYINTRFREFSLDQQQVIHELFVRSQFNSLTKTISKAYRDIGEFYPRDWIQDDLPDDIFIRNTVNNESLIKHRISNNLPFLFMDSGYTNFLESGKKWHRLCVNHIHSTNVYRKLNNKRMSIFPCLPQPWRTSGENILVVEPSAIQCKLFDIDIDQWRSWVRRELNHCMHHPRSIIFREKVDKKIRQNLYQYLCNEDIYCVVNYNSNAAVESIWAGVPVITLGHHITAPVASTALTQINDLRRPNLDQWLKTLSYSQYTIEEISNGTARRIMEEILHV